MGDRMRASEVDCIGHHPQEGIALLLGKGNFFQHLVEFCLQRFTQQCIGRFTGCLVEKKGKICAVEQFDRLRAEPFRAAACYITAEGPVTPVSLCLAEINIKPVRQMYELGRLLQLVGYLIKLF